EPDAVDKAFDSAVEIGIFKNDEWGFAAKFKRKALVAVGGRTANGPANFGGTCKSDFVYIGMFHQRFSGRAVAGDDVHHSGRQANFAAYVRKSKRGKRCKLRRFEDHRVTGCERGRDLPGQHEQREIPGNDLADDTTGGVIRELLSEQLRPAGVVIEVARYQWNVDITAFPNWFAIVQRLQNGEPARVALHCSGDGVQITRPPVRSQGLPFRKGLASSFNGHVDVCGRSLRYASDFFSRRGIQRIEMHAVNGLLPYTADKVAEGAVVAIEPGECVLGILGRGAVLHGQKVFSYAHATLLRTSAIMRSDADNLPSSGRLRNARVAAQCR